jgi:hypothetical protein
MRVRLILKVVMIDRTITQKVSNSINTLVVTSRIVNMIIAGEVAIDHNIKSNN